MHLQVEIGIRSDKHHPIPSCAIAKAAFSARDSLRYPLRGKSDFGLNPVKETARHSSEGVSQAISRFPQLDLRT
jgi:hypothetical protein